MQSGKRIFLLLGILWAIGYAQSIEFERAVARVDSLFKTYRYSAAQVIVDSLLRSHPEHPRVLIQAAILELSRFQPDPAIAYLEKAMKQDPQNAEVYFRLGNAYSIKINQGGFFSKMKSARKMKEYWEKALEKDPNYVDAMVALYNYYQMAPSIAGGDKEKAAELLTRIRQLAPEYEYYLLATQYHREKNDERAVEMLQRSIQTYPEFKPAYLTLAYIWIQKEKLDEAEKLLTQLLALDPQNIHALDELGEIYLQREDYAAACYHFRKALDIHPYYVQARYHLGMCLKRKGDVEEARKTFQFILDHFPKHPLAKRAKTELKN
ncbi:MAG: tetratricopeptide repeat protein [Calditrichaeota bacterium]|nr:tetratricopeptide repeat protein [Calditrichota bacterium]